MNEDEARRLLVMYADNLLEDEDRRALEKVLKTSPALQAELARLQELRKTGVHRRVSERGEALTDEMLTEALAPLRASQSKRMRLADHMRAVHAQARHVADTLPERGWRNTRLAICFVALLVSVLIISRNPIAPTRNDESFLIYYAIVSILFLGVIFTLAGSILARAEAWILGAFAPRDNVDPTRLEILVVEVFGIFCILGAGVLYWIAR